MSDLTVILPTKNSEKNIDILLKSLKEQDFQDFYLYVADGSSKDNTIEIIKKYKKYIRVIISEEDKGIYDAINKGIKQSTGSVVSILHSDDIFYESQTTQKVMSYFNSNLKLDCLIGNTIITKKNSKKIIRKYRANSFKKWMLYLGFSPPHTSTFLNNKIYKKYGLYNNKYSIAGDFEFFVRIFLKKKISFKIVNENFVLMKSGGRSSESLKSNFISSREIIKSFKDNNLYTNWLLIIFRFPLKLMQYIL